MCLIKPTLCSNLLVTAVFYSALYQNDEERPCLVSLITTLCLELALPKTTLLLNQEPYGYSALFAVYQPPTPPTPNVPVQVSILRSENTCILQ